MQNADHGPRLFAPAAYAAKVPAAIVEANPFALLVSATKAGIYATACPMCFEDTDGHGMLIGHMARRNLHAQALEPNQSALAVFMGPHAYISAAWYRDKPEVPTWNYVGAQVRGVLEPVDDLAAEREILRRTVDHIEANSAAPWTLEQAEPGRVETLLPMIRGFRIRIEQIDGVTKLSQTHPEADRLRVIQNLLERSTCGDVEIAAMMVALSSG